MADLRITELAALAGGDLAAGDLLAIADVSASETKKITVTDLVGNATTLIADATIPGAKILFGLSQIPASAITTGSITATQLADDAVSAAKLANESTVDLVTTLPASGAFVGQLALDTDDSKIYCWNGSTWVSVKAAGSVNTVIGDSSGIVNLSVATSGDQVTITTSLDNTSAAAQFLAGPTGSSGAVSYRTIAATDLPTATTSAKGAVIVNGNGLTLSGDTIAIDNSVTSSATKHLVAYDANGFVTEGAVIGAADLPLATSSAVGAVKPGTGLEVDVNGFINHSNSVTATTGTKITYDEQGHVVSSAALEAADIPDIDASKITTGTLSTDRIADAAVTGVKLANYTVSKFGETQPTADHIGQFFFNPLTRDLFLWDGNVFQPVGISAGEIVLAGTYDASTNLLDSVTAEGAAAGFTSGSALPAAATENSRYYVVVSQSGTGTAPAPTVTLEPPDILLSNGSSFILIETSETITAQVASNVGFTPTGNIASTNVQGALAEVDNEKVAKAGDTMTGNLVLDDANLVFEGSTANEFETTLTVVDPTADRTVTFPDASGTVLLSGAGGITNADISASAEIAVSKLADGAARQLLQTDSAGTGVEWTSNVDVPGTLDVTGAATFDSSVAVTGALTKSGNNVVTVGDTGTVTSTMILNGTIVDADINASAAIAGTKLQAASTSNAGAVQLTDSTSSTSTATAATPNSVKSAYDLADAALPKAGGALTGDVTLNAQSDLRFADSDSSNWVAFQAPATIASNVTWTLPSADGTASQVLSTDGSGTLSWTTPAGGGASVTTSDTAPSSPSDGDLWYDSVGGRTYVYYDDGDTSQWVDAAPQGGSGGTGTKIEVGNTKAEVTDTGSDGAFVVTTEGSERLRVDSSGRTLIGTTSGSHPLSVVSSQSSKIQFGQAADKGGFLFSDGDGAFGIAGGGYYNGANWVAKHTSSSHIRDDGDANLAFFTNTSLTVGSSFTPTERMRIDSSGNLLLQKTSAARTGGGTFFEVPSGPTTMPVYLHFCKTFSGTRDGITFNHNGTQVGGVIFTDTSTAFNTSSDYRLKENVVPLTGAADRLKQIPVHRFNFIADPDKTVDGFLAHEAQAVVPECVTGTKDEVDADGNPVYQGIDQSKLVPLITAALQEALQKIETQAGVITALNARITALEAN